MNRLIRKYRTIFLVGARASWVRLLLQIIPLPRVLDRLHPGQVTEQRDLSGIDDVVYYLDRWLHLFPYNAKGNCFPRSLVLYWFARRWGYPVVFHCGVRKEGASLDGHAWLTLNGHAFQEPSQQWRRFTVTFCYPTSVETQQVESPVSHNQPAIF